MPHVGMDSKKFEIGTYNKRFEALLGVAVTVNEENKFRQYYDKIMNRICKSYDIERKQLVFKSTDLANFIPYKFTEFFSEFLKHFWKIHK